MIFLLLMAVWVADESVKVRPDALPVAEPPRVQLVAAGGDCAGAQIAVRGPVQALSATASGLAVDAVELREPSKLTRAQRQSWRRAWVDDRRAGHRGAGDGRARLRQRRRGRAVFR